MDLIDRIADIASVYFNDAASSHRWDHTWRVYKLAVSLGEQEKADLEIVSVAALLHDIGRTREDKSRGEHCHATWGAEMAREILTKEGIEKERIDRIAHCIATHRFRDDKLPETLEASVLFDADKLDAIGAVGIGRAFLFAGEVGAQLHDQAVDINTSKPYTYEDTAYREYLVKLRYVKDRMLTAGGYNLALARHHFMVSFFDRLNQEVDGKL